MQKVEKDRLKSPRVYIVILNYNGERWIEECLSTVLRTAYDNYRVVFVDNNSSDNSVEVVAANFPVVELVVNYDNLGFCEGNNVGIRRALVDDSTKYVVLLNTDTRVTPNWLSEIVNVGESNPEIGVLSGVQLTYKTSEFNPWTRKVLKQHLDELRNHSTCRKWIETDRVEGSCFAIKRAVIEEVGLLDPIYFMYYEDTDYCRRARAHNYRVAIVTRSLYHHYRGGSATATNELSKRRNYLLDRSRLIYVLTDPQLSLSRNLVNYCKKGIDLLLTRILQRDYLGCWNIVRLQPLILICGIRVISKIKRDRHRLLSRGKCSFDLGSSQIPN